MTPCSFSHGTRARKREFILDLFRQRYYCLGLHVLDDVARMHYGVTIV
jgi:hypothetical protein